MMFPVCDPTSAKSGTVTCPETNCLFFFPVIRSPVHGRLRLCNHCDRRYPHRSDRKGLREYRVESAFPDHRRRVSSTIQYPVDPHCTSLPIIRLTRHHSGLVTSLAVPLASMAKPILSAMVTRVFVMRLSCNDLV